MRILLINQTWFAAELRQMGHEVVSCGTSSHLDIKLPSPIVDIEHLLNHLPNGFKPERLVWLDNSSPMGIVGIENCEIPSLFYSIDTHHHYLTHSHIATCFDHALVAQKDFIPDFTSFGTPTTWLPLWASEYVEHSTEKKHGAVFVGTLDRKLNPARVEFFERLQELIPIEVLTGHFPSIFPFSEIVVNQTVKGDLNFRVFEAMMSGALLLTEEAEHGLTELFVDGTHLVTYKPRNPEDAAQKVRELLANPTRMRAIAKAGRDEILAKHLPIHRAKTIENLLLTLTKRKPSPHRHYAAVMSLLSIECLIEQTHTPFACELLLLGLDAARRGLVEGARPSSIESTYIMKTCLKHDSLLKKQDGNTVIHEYAEKFPDSQLFSLLQIRALLNEGKVNQAKELARRLSADTPVDITFSTAERAVEFIME
jgi:hypothetical protein